MRSVTFGESHLAAAFLAAVLLSIAGCGPDTVGADNAKKLVGKWEDKEDDRTYEFGANGYYKTVSRKWGFIVEGTFSVHGNEVTIRFDGKSQTFAIMRLTDKELATQLYTEDKATALLQRIQ
jgi:uncharacterized protein (TIGR03066 family)